MARKMRIGLDLDGVCYPWSPAVRKILTEYHGYPDIGESTHWDFVKDAIDPKHWKWLWTDGVVPMFSQDMCYPGASTFMRDASREYTVIVISHRPMDAAPSTYRFLAQHDVHAQSVHILGPDTAKSDVMPACDVYIDDKPEVCSDIIDNIPRAHVFMPHRDWNRGFTIDSKRFHTYDRFKEVRTWLTSKTT